MENKHLIKNTPFGHGKAESIAAFTVSFIIHIVGGGLLISSISNYGKEAESPSIYAVYGAVAVSLIFYKFVCLP